MSETIAQVNASPGADTFQIWVDQTNKAINAISTVVVSVNTHANGGLTTGNGFVEGIFGARNLIANTFRGGTVETPSQVTLTSNLDVTGDKITVGDVVINSSAIVVGGIILETGGSSFTTTTTGATPQVIDYFDKLTYRSADYVLSIKDNNANAYQASKILVVHDGSVTDAQMIEYGIVYTNTAMGIMSANANSTHVRVFFTPVSTNTTVKGSKTLVGL